MPSAIEQLIPHRAPMRWVDALIDCTETTATATTMFTANHFAVAHPQTSSAFSLKAGECREQNSPKQNFAYRPTEPTPCPSQEGNYSASASCNAPLRAPLLGGAGGGFSANPQPNGFVIETALVECMAQTVAAALGQRMRASGKSGAANNGMLAAVSNFKIHSSPPMNLELTIEVREVKRLGPMLMIAGTISCGTRLIATGELSLYA